MRHIANPVDRVLNLKQDSNAPPRQQEHNTLRIAATLDTEDEEELAQRFKYTEGVEVMRQMGNSQKTGSDSKQEEEASNTT